jgi:hypothetical protein
MLSCLPTIASVAYPYSPCAPRPLPPPGVAMPPRSSRMIVRASSSSRLDRVSLSPHLHSKSVRSSECQSSSRPRSVSLSPHLHPRTIRPEQSTSRSSSSEEKPTFPPFALEVERSRPATRRGGDASPGSEVYPTLRSRNMHIRTRLAPEDSPPPEVPVRAKPAPSLQSTQRWGGCNVNRVRPLLELPKPKAEL